jgi:hypothetical protein
MRKIELARLISIGILIVMAWLYACSDRSDIIRTSSSDPEPQSIEQFFPLVLGKSSEFTISENGAESISREKYTIGNGVEENSRQLHEWIHTYEDHPNFADTGYFYLTPTTLYFYEDASATPEKILEAPLEVGKSWQRYDREYLTDYDISDLINALVNAGGLNYDDLTNKDDNGRIGVEVKNDIPNDDITGLVLGKGYPTTTSNYMTITAIEDIELENGYQFENCIRVESQNGSQYTNYYWYASGFGLVKYIIGGTEESLLAGDDDSGVVGEILKL